MGRGWAWGETNGPKTPLWPLQNSRKYWCHFNVFDTPVTSLRNLCDSAPLRRKFIILEFFSETRNKDRFVDKI